MPREEAEEQRLNDLRQRQNVEVALLHKQVDSLDNILYEFRKTWSTVLDGLTDLAVSQGIIDDSSKTRELRLLKEEYELRLKQGRRALASFEDKSLRLSARHRREREQLEHDIRLDRVKERLDGEE